jgi:2'-5' RNA ligase
MKKMRIFVAIELPEDLRKRIFAVSQKIAKKIPLRLVTEGNIHLTLLFLGERSDEEARKIKSIIGAVAKTFPPFFLKIENLEFYPSPARPHGIWINVGGEKEKLFSLYKKIVDGLLKEGIKLRENELKFPSHITIGRIKEKTGRAGRPSEFNEFKEDLVLRIDKVTVFRSQLSSAGPTYFKLAEFRLL